MYYALWGQRTVSCSAVLCFGPISSPAHHLLCPSSEFIGPLRPGSGHKWNRPPKGLWTTHMSLEGPLIYVHFSTCFKIWGMTLSQSSLISVSHLINSQSTHAPYWQERAFIQQSLNLSLHFLYSHHGIYCPYPKSYFYLQRVPYGVWVDHHLLILV